MFSALETSEAVGIGGIIAAFFTGVGMLLGRYFPYRIKMAQIGLDNLRKHADRQDKLLAIFEKCMTSALDMHKDCRDAHQHDSKSKDIMFRYLERVRESLKEQGFDIEALPEMPAPRAVDPQLDTKVEYLTRTAAQARIMLQESTQRVVEDSIDEAAKK